MEINKKLNEVIVENYMPYAMSVISSRALPEIDGLKPAHRKLLYTMYMMKLLKGEKTKSQNIVGQTMQLNPHGDAAIYETLIRLTTDNEALLYPYINSKGNFGKQYSKIAPAASRYTSCKLAPIAEELFKDIDKNLVDFVDNYDNTLKEPVLLPTTFPNILVNVNQGIAVSMASDMISFNLQEIIDSTIALIENENSNLLKYITGPDLSTGGICLVDETLLQTVIETGTGSFKIRSVYEHIKEENRIIIREIPYTTTVEAIQENIEKLILEGKIKEISDVRNEMSKEGLALAIELKRGIDVNILMEKLYKLTPLQDTFSCNFNVLINGYPKVLGVRNILLEWLKFRIGCVKRKLNFEILENDKELHLLYGMQKILLDIDKVISTIKDSEDKEIIPNLMQVFDIDEIQADYIANLRLKHINKEYVLKQTENIHKLEQKNKEINDILLDENKIKDYIKQELLEIKKKYKSNRKTQIVHTDDIQVLDDLDLVSDYNCKLFVTYEGFIKKIPAISYRATSEHKLKQDDTIRVELDTTNKSTLLIFTSTGNIYKERIFDIEECKAGDLGIVLEGLNADEKIIGAVATSNYSENLLVVYESGKILKLSLGVYATKNNRKKLVKAIKTDKGIYTILSVKDNEEYVVCTSKDNIGVFKIADLPLRLNKGVNGISIFKLGKKEYITKFCNINALDIVDKELYRLKEFPSKLLEKQIFDII